MQDENNPENFIISGTMRSFRTLQDGTLAVTIDIPPSLAINAIKMINSTDPGIPVLIKRDIEQG